MVKLRIELTGAVARWVFCHLWWGWSHTRRFIVHMATPIRPNTQPRADRGKVVARVAEHVVAKVIAQVAVDEQSQHRLRRAFPDPEYDTVCQRGGETIMSVTEPRHSARTTDRTAADNTATLFNRLWFYIQYGWRFLVLQQPAPLIYGIAPTDRCNLDCRGCQVHNTQHPDMTWQQLVDTMQQAYDRGFRELYLSGGEPMLWRDGDRTIEDAIQVARRIGYFHVHVYTNGTLGLDTTANLIWVSMDGLPGTFELRRGDHFDEVEHAVRNTEHGKVAVIYVIDHHTAPGVEDFLRWVRDTRFPITGVMFYFHTPYYGKDELYLEAHERAPIIDRLLEYLRKGLPILNSRAGLLALKSGNWPRRLPVASVADIDGESVCCRVGGEHDENCRDCGFAACTEITEFQRWRPSAMLAMRQYW